MQHKTLLTTDRNDDDLGANHHMRVAISVNLFQDVLHFICQLLEKLADAWHALISTDHSSCPCWNMSATKFCVTYWQN